MFTSFRTRAVGGRQGNAIKRQTESCPTSISEDTGTLFATRFPRTSCGSECPLTHEKKADKTGHAGHPSNRPPAKPTEPEPMTPFHLQDAGKAHETSRHNQTPEGAHAAYPIYRWFLPPRGCSYRRRRGSHDPAAAATPISTSGWRSPARPPRCRH